MVYLGILEHCLIYIEAAKDVKIGSNPFEEECK